MHPPKVAAADVRAVIQALTVGSTLPSGAAVRRALAKRFGARGGVARIYRLLAEARIQQTPKPASPPAGSLEALQAEVLELRQRLARAELREEAHQTYWALEVDRLRQRVAVLEPLAQQAQSSQEIAQGLRHQLQAAVRRAVQFEEQLLALQHSTGQGSEAATRVLR